MEGGLDNQAFIGIVVGASSLSEENPTGSRCSRNGKTLSDLVGSIDSERKHGNLSSAIRLFVLNHYQARPTHEGQTRRSPAREMIMMPPQPVSVLRAE